MNENNHNFHHEIHYENNLESKVSVGKRRMKRKKGLEITFKIHGALLLFIRVERFLMDFEVSTEN